MTRKPGQHFEEQSRSMRVGMTPRTTMDLTIKKSGPERMGMLVPEEIRRAKTPMYAGPTSIISQF